MHMLSTRIIERSCLTCRPSVSAPSNYKEPKKKKKRTDLFKYPTLCTSSSHLNTSLCPSSTASTSFAIRWSLGAPPFLPFSAAFKIHAIPWRVRCLSLSARGVRMVFADLRMERILIEGDARRTDWRSRGWGGRFVDSWLSHLWSALERQQKWTERRTAGRGYGGPCFERRSSCRAS